jgi:predicted ester cyclase
MTRAEIEEVLARRHAALQGRDRSAMETLYADSIHIESPLLGNVKGREAATAATWAFFEAFPDVTIKEDLYGIDGDRVTIVAHIGGTHTGELLGQAPTGRKFRFRAAFLLRIANGAIVEEQRIYDFTGLLVQIGVLKAKPA